MNRELVLAILYDLTLTIGSEIRLKSLLTKVLQRFLYHTGFPVGVVLLDQVLADQGVSARLAAVIGDYALGQKIGQILTFPVNFVFGKVELIEDSGLALVLGSSGAHAYFLKLPVDDSVTIFLLSPKLPENTLPLTQIFQPVLRNLSKAIILCRSHEQETARLALDRDQARHDLIEALRKAERERAFQRSLMDSIPDLVWLKDPKGVYMACNPSFEKLYGKKEAEIIGKTDYDFVATDLAEANKAMDQLALAAKNPTIHEVWLSFVEGEYHGQFEITKTPMRSTNGDIIGVLGIAHDITEIKAAQIELTRHRNNLEQLVLERSEELKATYKRLSDTQFAMDSVGIGIHWVDARNGQFLYVNQVAAEMLGYSVDEMLQLNVADIDTYFSKNDFQTVTQDFRQQASVQFETVEITKYGETLPVEATIYYLPVNCLVSLCLFPILPNEKKLNWRSFMLKKQPKRRMSSKAHFWQTSVMKFAHL